jgi:putative ABC transport system permease protein
VLINEEMAGELGVQNPVGEKIYTEIAEFTIIGVVKNFNYESLREPVGPVILNFNDKSGNFSAFRIGDANMKDVISQINTVWEKLEPQYPLSYYFMNDAFDNIYRADQTMGKISITASILAILIACIGLFGLIAYASEKRRKEIGIRKVMGASVVGIVQLLSKDFVKLVIVAILIASPIAWYAMHQWLQDFAYRITIEWWMFALAGLIAVVIALLTVSFQAIKAALANPVKSLRSE